MAIPFKFRYVNEIVGGFVLLVVLLLLVVLFGAWLILGRAGLFSNLAPQPVTAPVVASRPAGPSADADGAIKMETATFALG